MICSRSVAVALLGAASVFATPAPAPTPALNLDHAVARRAACTFTGALGYEAANASKKACSTIVLADMQVPGGKTLNLEDLNAGTTVCSQALSMTSLELILSVSLG